MRLLQWHEQVRLSTLQLGVSYDTTASQLKQLPALIRRVVEHHPHLHLQSCRLMAIADFSYNLVFRLHGSQSSLGASKDSLHLLNQRLLSALAEAGIEIPFPTQPQLQREG